MLAMNVWGDAGRRQEPPEEQDAAASAVSDRQRVAFKGHDDKKTNKKKMSMF